MDVPVFSTSPDPTCMYQTPALKKAVAKIRTAVARKQGLCCIFGDVGIGKSSLLRWLLSGYSADENFFVAFLPSGDLPSSFAFVKKISTEFDIPPQRSRLAQMDAIEEFLVAQHAAGKTVVLLIDEAQLLSLDYLETIRSLLNYETNTEKMIQIILSGQLDLRDRLELKRYRAFRSRIVAPVLMAPLTAEETKAMIAYRLEFWEISNPFTHEAAIHIHRLTSGVPRSILLTCQYSYDIAQGRSIGPEIVEQGFAELAIRDEATEAAVA
jgi:type II secretory pathway predicted ATPase ExeA